jgi:predicted transcriptional regulator
MAALTPRRRETLAELRELSAQAGGAVHYSLVAARMRISAWTAYSLLRELEKMGLVLRRYAREPRSGGGRSRILFLPAPAGAADPLRDAVTRLRAVADESAAALARLGRPRLATQLTAASARLTELLDR